MHARYPTKFLPDGTLNPKWKKRASGKSGKSGHKATLFESGNFIAWDGEGWNTGKKIDEATLEHIYTLLANSEGASIADNSGLSTEKIFDFLLNEAERHKKAIHVVYGGSYDMNMFMRDFDRDTAQQIWDNGGEKYTFWKKYAIKFIPRRSFELHELKSANAPFIETSRGSFKLNSLRHIKLWDVIGFFQGTFLNTITTWLGPSYPDYELIKEGKLKRSNFEDEDTDFIERYNKVELKALVEIMNRFRQSMSDVGLQIAQWHGAGAVASAILRKHKIKEHYAELPPDVHDATLHAYFGGRIELGKYGYERKIMHRYDINSAYPYAQYQLPSLANGIWVHHKNLSYAQVKKLHPLSFVLVQWSFTDNALFYPFPYRTKQNAVLFPSDGKNWICLPEVLAALEQYNDGMIFYEAWEFISASDEKPFSFIKEYYEQRQRIVQEAKQKGVSDGREKVLKLGLNSLYGKTAQRVGSGHKRPQYHNLAYAAYITSFTRARLYSAAMQDSKCVIALCTDGIFSECALDLDVSTDKKFGAWEHEALDMMLSVQSGFYYYESNAKITAMCRGFDRISKDSEYANKVNKQIQQILTAWKESADVLYLPSTRFITLGTALDTDDWFSRWCSWYQSGLLEGLGGRALALLPNGTKRVCIPQKNEPPHEKLCITFPKENLNFFSMSAPYKLAWDESDTAMLQALLADSEIDV